VSADLAQPDLAGFTRLELSGRLYSPTTLLKACYSLADQAAFAISRFDDETSSIVIHLRPRIDASIEKLVLQLSDRLLEFELRERLEERTRTLRDLIYAAALAEVDLLEEAPSDQTPPASTP
jgi:His-Xaa-Ser system protein HxsD